MQLDFISNDEGVRVEVSRDGQDWRLQLDGQPQELQAVRSADGSWLVATPQGRRRLWVVANGAERLVFCDGRVHTLRLTDPDHEDEPTETGADSGLIAVMPGKVVKVLVAGGDRIAAGQVLLILESMKMETEITAARAGVVDEVRVAAGQLVAQGDVLATMAADSEGDGP